MQANRVNTARVGIQDHCRSRWRVSRHELYLIAIDACAERILDSDSEAENFRLVTRLNDRLCVCEPKTVVYWITERVVCLISADPVA